MVRLAFTKAEKEMLYEEYSKVWESEKMRKYCVGAVSTFVYIRDYIVTFDKEHIKTDFCFGEHGFDYDEVNATCAALSRDEQYFIDENMKSTTAASIIGRLDGDSWPYWRKQYPILVPSKHEGCRLAHLEWTTNGSEASKEPMALTDGEIRLLRWEMEREQQKFEKRLRAYLKRYGMSKCNFWTYWADR